MEGVAAFMALPSVVAILSYPAPDACSLADEVGDQWILILTQ